MRIAVLPGGDYVDWIGGRLVRADGTEATLDDLKAAERLGALTWASPEIRASIYATGAPSSSPSSITIDPAPPASPTTSSEAAGCVGSTDGRINALARLTVLVAILEALAIVVGSPIVVGVVFQGVFVFAASVALYKRASMTERLAVVAVLAAWWAFVAWAAGAIVPAFWTFTVRDAVFAFMLLGAVFGPELGDRLAFIKGESRYAVGAGLMLLFVQGIHALLMLFAGKFVAGIIGIIIVAPIAGLITFGVSRLFRRMKMLSALGD